MPPLILTPEEWLKNDMGGKRELDAEEKLYLDSNLTASEDWLLKHSHVESQVHSSCTGIDIAHNRHCIRKDLLC